MNINIKSTKKCEKGRQNFKRVPWSKDRGQVRAKAKLKILCDLKQILKRN